MSAATDTISKVNNEISANQQAANKYLEYANQVGLSEDYKSKIRNGQLSIENITDENTRDLVSKYKDKSVCEEWLNYANFKLWYDEHFISAKNNQIDLDKDLLVQGNTNYSLETCVFLIHYQNLMFEGKRGNCVYVNKDGTFSVDGKKNNSYKTYEEALEFVAVRQIEKIESIAEKCKGTIPMCAYEAMLNWDVRLAMCG